MLNPPKDEKKDEAKQPAKTSDDYEVRDDFSAEIIEDYEQRFTSIFEGIHFPLASSAHFDKDLFDVMFGSLSKNATMGGGYSSIINSVMLLAFMQMLIDDGKYPSGFLVLDSPLTALSESEFQKVETSIKQGFYDYLASSVLQGQVIIADQKERIPAKIKNSDKVNIIEFTQSLEHGRSGFIPGRIK